MLAERNKVKKKKKLTQAHAHPSESSARQCHPPVAACTILEPNRAEILRGFLSAEDEDEDAAPVVVAPPRSSCCCCCLPPSPAAAAAAEALEGPCPSVPLAFQPQASTLPSASSASVQREPATSGQRLNARPRRRVPRSASTTFGDRTSAAPSRPSWPSSLTPGVRVASFFRRLGCGGKGWEGSVSVRGGAIERERGGGGGHAEDGGERRERSRYLKDFEEAKRTERKHRINFRSPSPPSQLLLSSLTPSKHHRLDRRRRSVRREVSGEGPDGGQRGVGVEPIGAIHGFRRSMV